ncbi:sensor histidine kinase [Lutibaculum baratangense]|uniref:histidine kinase n=1 Tax=Lutibaculum baratangense AMV1 TaxID=631454 RepID=V4RLP0_9HYPH|nr:sensor histidine kinase [Lutibaculum baratangense]ESR24165.1 hypothetical protein N177_2614 [Lutibaculum baratangense AMV1]
MENRSHELALREIRHRLSNSFQLINSYIQLRARRVAGEETRRELMELANLVQSIGTLQEQLAAPGGDFAGFLDQAAQNWRRLGASDGHDALRVEVEAEPIALPDQTVCTLALIAHELVTNAIEHGFPAGSSRRLRILFRRDGQEVELAVVDNGRGAAEDAADGQGSMGLHLVEILSRQLGGRFELSSGQGTVASVRLPSAERR